jgi:hypothetical protein
MPADESDACALSIKVLRERVPEVAATILKELPVADLNIEEEDIANVIETILRRGSVSRDTARPKRPEVQP